MIFHKQAISPDFQKLALDWILAQSDSPSAGLEPEFDIGDDKLRYAKKIRNISNHDPQFWQAWSYGSGLTKIVSQYLDNPRLLRHAAFIKRHADESFIPLHQDIALWEKPFNTAWTFWVALTPAFKENGGMFYLPDTDVVYPHEFDLNYPMFKCIDLEKNQISQEELKDVSLQAGDILVWPAKTPHGSYMNISGQLRIGMPIVFVEENEYQKLM
ncbi:phytanoyl-CoA dioxygenase family protein [Xenorhabdus bovienii]|uniref:Phytanoyl-CoA dioxygenase n=1 Tax=Xenorhabdus bovienii str. puntauvense TaxID=1398201 RepID=A0A077NEN4_XENBV|nr:phytanoyl-CoA dioxygenase family protein [Xenorhabdus bovienii]MDE1488096.1 phytanoyl-CoA dioxygenase family protein [Xenorhabdus bovienii]MDE1496713.1 phytanoyl-CoA dioxygenase family protein [Xenorhabdus bovienii]MDE9447067.1 phytanoyl-CoA dioxygenase family protein [Xenorhabdus bovienii]MDE9472928.1 phytanoyl-CoA dioxygenase family protein [Xenorhabdus bovienii]MDE9478986.1 phytanoyl-CoA dioxygenase family protein [Xenorhabdus bovienii]